MVLAVGLGKLHQLLVVMPQLLELQFRKKDLL
jgi:hypothetical protein